MSKKISLCMIVGNVDNYIYRCLESFLPFVDEVVMVRAIGNQQPDDTVRVAEKLVYDWFGETDHFKFAEYKNAPEHDWPHVDNFAAARQMSYNIAEGDYCLWCDSDDVLARGGETIRALADRAEYAAYKFDYDIIGRNVVLPRERMMRKDCGKWRHRVHECFEFNNPNMAVMHEPSVVFEHRPELSKSKDSSSRNLRILESCPDSEMTCGMLYHMFVELVAVDRDRAVEVGRRLAEHPDIGRPEHYTVMMELMLQTEDLQMRKALLHESHKIDHTRREALGVLAGTAMDMGNADDAIAYASQMLATPEPRQHAWNSRRSFYGYVAEDVYQQALRFADRKIEAESRRRAWFERVNSDGKVIISLLHATRGRPKEASKARKLWFDLAAEPERIEHIFAIDADDLESMPLTRMHSIIARPGGGCVAAWNDAAYTSCGQVMVQMSDDFVPPMHWDRLIVERIGDVTKPKVLAVNDGLRTDQLLCMAIITNQYYQTDGFLFHPWFKGVYSDNWFTERAYARGAVIEARDIVFKHNHYLGTGDKPDETYKAQNDPARYKDGAATMEILRARKDWSSVPGFFNYRHWYEAAARCLNDGDKAVEVGSWLGRSIIFLAQELKRQGKHGVKLYAVDHFKGESNQKEHEATVKLAGGSVRQVFEENVNRCGVEDMITVIEGDSADSAKHFEDGSLAFCWIDAAHDYESVKRDILAWRPKMRKGGLFSGHDAQWHEVERAVKEIVPNAEFMGCLWAERPSA